MTDLLNDLADQYRGRRLAELILDHAGQGLDQNRMALAEMMAELRDGLREPVAQLIDFLVAMPQADAKRFFAEDLGTQFVALIGVVKGFLKTRHNIQITVDEAFTIFNILVVNWALACNIFPQTKAAMQKAARQNLLQRVFGR